MHVPFVLQRVCLLDRPGQFLVLRVDYGAGVADLRPTEGISRAVLARVPFHNICPHVATEASGHTHSRRGRAAQTSPPEAPASTEPVES